MIPSFYLSYSYNEESNHVKNDLDPTYHIVKANIQNQMLLDSLNIYNGSYSLFSYSNNFVIENDYVFNYDLDKYVVSYIDTAFLDANQNVSKLNSC